MIKRCGIYFLLQNLKPVYIGKTTNLETRIRWHDSQRMGYNALRFIACKEENLDYYEGRWIKKFKPKFNQRLTGVKKKYKVKKLEIRSVKWRIPKKPMHFRKLTKKSIVGFGRNRDREVDFLLKSGKIFDLIDAYFSLSHITFFDDILDELKITPEWRIEKPGIDKEKGYAFKHAVYPDLCETRQVRNKIRMRGNARNFLNEQYHSLSKTNLKAKNEGH